MSGSTRAERRQTAILYLCVGVGCVIGSVARYLVSLALQMIPGLPWGTLFVNVTGSFIIGFYSTLSGPDGRLFASAEQRQFVMTGICGGYTTFSSFSLETFRLLQSGRTASALIYIVVSIVGCLVGVWLGHVMASRFNRLKGS
jgi:fluoride exporter